MSSRILPHAFTCALVLVTIAASPPRGLPPRVVPEPFGVNIHFVVPDEAEADALAAVGYRIVRMDFAWGGIERRSGEYDFSGYDKLVDAMAKRQIRCLFILDYANRLYDDDLAPHTDAGRAAFAKWAAAAAKHFAGKGIIWELWNEPNLAQFWKPVPSAEDYAKLAHAVINAVRAADPEAYIIGPATSTFPWKYFETLAERGVLAKFDAISVHPYRQQPPETAAADYNRLRLLLDRASPKKQLPIISGEWGYSTGWGGMTEEKQAQYLVRQWLFNMSQDIGLSIWYDWKDDGADPKEPEHHFGSVYRDLKDKPATKAAATLCKTLKGLRYVRRLATKDAADHVLLFAGDDRAALAAWTTAPGHSIQLDLPRGQVKIIDMLGDQHDGSSGEKGLAVELGASPKYLLPTLDKAAVYRLSTLRPMDAIYVVRAGEYSDVFVEIDRFGGRLTLAVNGASVGSIALDPEPDRGQSVVKFPFLITQRDQGALDGILTYTSSGVADLLGTARVTLLVENSIAARLAPSDATTFYIMIENPSGSAMAGKLTAAAVTSKTTTSFAVGKNEKQALVRIGMPPNCGAVRVEASDAQGNTLFRIAPTRWAPLPINVDQPWRAWAEGDRKVEASAGVSVVDAPNPPVGGISKSLQLDYRFAKGWRYACIAPPDALARIEGRPRELGLWLFGDGSGNALRARFKDSTGQTFQATYGAIDWTGWKWVTIPLDGTEHHWGGANDGQIHYPIRWDAAALIDGVPLKVGQPLRIHIAGTAIRY